MILKRNLHKRNIARRGFTLVEVLVAIALFSIFTLTVTRLLMGGMDTFKRGQAISAMQNELRGALDLITAEFRAVQGQNANTIVSPSVLEGTTPTARLAFTRIVQNLTDPMQTDTEVVTYQLDRSGTLVRSVNSEDVLVADNILLGDTLGSDFGANPKSYFAWYRNEFSSTQEVSACNSNVLDIRLTCMKYVGREEKTMTMSTRANVRSKGSPFVLPATLYSFNKTKLYEGLPSDTVLPVTSRSFLPQLSR